MAQPTGARRLPERTRFDTCGLAALGLLAALLPFELTQPVLLLGSIEVTNVELALYLVLIVWAVIWLRGRRSAWTVVHSAAAAWLAVVVFAALLAPTGRGEALKFALRTLGGGALFFATLDLVSTRRQIAWIALAVCAGAVLSAATGIAEVWLPPMRAGLETFKTQPSFAGGFLRASGTFQYANTAGMYWEAVLPLTLALGVWAVTGSTGNGRPASTWRWWSAAAAVVLVQAVVLTASRAAWWAVACLLAVLLVAGVRLFRPLRGPVVVVCLALMLFTLGGWGGGGLLALRLLASDEATWLSAEFTNPPTALTMPTGSVTTVPMTVRNTGLREWPRQGSTPVSLSYHWLAPDGEEVLLWDGARTRLPDTVAAGDTVTLQAVIDGIVPPGRYRLQWDLVQEHIAWFSTLGAQTATTWVAVEPRDDAPVVAELPPSFRLVYRERPSRRTLWSAAVGMWAERPLFGIGPDQFRHQVGARLDLATFDTRTHASSLFVETLVGQGLVGLLALLSLLAAVTWTVVRGWQRVDGPAPRVLGLGLALGMLAYAAHGAVDHFLSFTPTYGLFWLLTGLTVRLFGQEATA